MLKRDYFFEFAGMPKSGKTTVLDIVVHYLKRQGLKIHEYHGGGRYSPIDKSSIGSLNLYLAGKAIDFLLSRAEREKNQNKIFIMDRGIFDRCIFTAALQKMNKIESYEAEVLESYLTLPRLTDKIDAVFLFVTTPQVSINREYANKLIEQTGRVMNTQFLENLRSSSLEVSQRLQTNFSGVSLIDTAKLDGKPTDTARIVADAILSIINEEDQDAK